MPNKTLLQANSSGALGTRLYGRWLSPARIGTAIGIGLFFLLLVLPAQAQRPQLPNDDQIKVNLAIQKGVSYLLARQQAQRDGSFPGFAGHPVGVTALAGLALLEAGVGPKETSMQAAANFIRLKWKTLDDTYDLALAVLFLDRLGERKDEGLINAFAARLIGGQTTTGGWSYKCPIFTQRDQNELFRVLRRFDELEKALEPAAQGANGQARLKAVAVKPGAGAGDENAPGGAGSTGQAATRLLTPRPGMCIKLADASEPPSAAMEPMPEAQAPKEEAKPADKPGETPAKPEKGAVPTVAIRGPLATLPVVQDLNKFGEIDAMGNPDRPVASKDPKAHTDNSNTQFAILAMWTAQKHKVPTRRTLKLLVKRFRESQNVDGGWSYGYARGNSATASTPAMTCAGLSGLAVGMAMTSDKKAAKEAEILLVKRAFRCLMKFIGEPSEKFDKRVPLEENTNLYYLWSIERVAVMYNLATVGAKDWYRWGAEILVTNQEQAGQHPGAWVNGGNATLSDPVVNTSFALLFLRGANLTSDLTDQLPFNTGELNRELAGEGDKPGKRPEKSTAKSNDPLGSSEDKDDQRPVDVLPTLPKEDKPTVTQPSQPAPTKAPAPIPSSSSTAKQEDSGGKGMMIAIFAVVAVLVIGGVGAAIFFATRSSKKSQQDDAPRAGKKGRRREEDEEDEEEVRPTPRRAAPPPRGRPAPRRPTRARYDDDEEDED